MITIGGATEPHQARIVELAAAGRLPAMYSDVDPVRMGGLMAVRQSAAEIPVTLARFVDRILKGASPGELPAEYPTRLDFMINLHAARAMGLEVPPAVLAQATEVIR